LERLFANLLLLNQDSCSTTSLTDSFGWSNNEVSMIFEYPHGKDKHFIQKLMKLATGLTTTRRTGTESDFIFRYRTVPDQYKTIRSDTNAIQRNNNEQNPLLELQKNIPKRGKLPFKLKAKSPSSHV
jgi:hypothetical protein